MDKANIIHHKDLLYVINIVIDTKGYCYRMKLEGNLNGPCELRGNSVVDYAGDNNNQKL